MKLTDKPFPVDALGPILADAVIKVAAYVEVPVELPAQAAIAVASTLCQAHFNVNIMGVPEPTSLYLLAIAPSGERKTTACSLINTPINNRDKSRNIAFKQQLKRFNSEHRDFNSIVDKEPGCPKPEPPRLQRIIEADATTEALMRDLVERYPSKLLCSTEAGTLFGGYSFQNETSLATYANLSNVWDGGAVSRTRMGNDLPGGYDRRLTINLMAQPEVAKKILDDKMAQRQGFLARFLVCRPESKIGYRSNKLRREQELDLQSYYGRVSNILDHGPKVDEDGGLKLGTLIFDDDALELLEEFSGKLEKGMRPDGPLQSATAFVSKLTAHVGRMAAALTFFEKFGKSDQFTIDRQAVESACALGEYYLGEHFALYMNEDEVLEVFKRFFAHHKGQATINQIRDGAPKATGLRKAGCREIRAAMERLTSLGIVACYGRNKNGNADSWKWL